MVWDILGEAVLSAVLGPLFDRLSSPFIKKFFRVGDRQKLLEKLRGELLTIYVVLSDAEEKQITNPRVREWVNQLKDAAYQADDLLDEIDTLSRKAEDKGKCKVMVVMAKQVRRLFPTNSQCDEDEESSLELGKKIESRVEKIADRLGYLAEKRDLLNLRESVRAKPPSMLPTTSLVDGSEVFGRDRDKVELRNILLADDAQENGIPVIAIVGIGGIGKTTLAQLVYNDPEVNVRFGVRGWAYVSEEFDVFKVTRTIYNSVTSEDCNVGDLNVLQVKLQERLMTGKYLLVLDNIWNENFNAWDLLSKPLKAGAHGGKIIVTTRNLRVATTMGASVIYSLQHLSDEDCWSLFAKHAFRTHNPEVHPTVKEIGESIVKKCQGLPLAAKTLGGLLHSKIEVEEWHRILNSKIWDIPNDRSSILPALRVSYYHLPPHLKECFAYCSIFPKGYEIEKEQVVLLWMAEGLLRQPNGNDTMEDVGDEYFQELLSRSFFQSSQNDLLFVMHDLVNDLAQYASGEFCSKFEDGKVPVIGKNVRHFAFLMDPVEKDGPEKFVYFNEVKSLRTFLPLTCLNPSRCFALGEMVLPVLLQKMKHLRVLSVSRYAIDKLPNSLGKLTHLRYLDLSYTSIRELPSSIGSLYNLQTLLLSNCYCLTVLPTKIVDLINLRHLDVSDTNLEEMPCGFGRLMSLRVLTNFVVGRDSGSKISELGNLSQLRTLHILRLQNVVNATEASEANLKNTEYLSEILFEWSTSTTDTGTTDNVSNGIEVLNRLQPHDNVSNGIEVLNRLQPHKNLKKLTIKNYSDMRFPDWLGDVIFSNMVFLHLNNCENCMSLPPLGQLVSLQKLYIENCKKLKPQECWGLHGMKYLRHFEITGGCNTLMFFPQVELLPNTLTSLRISRLPKLTFLGEALQHLTLLEKLEISCCEELMAMPPYRLPTSLSSLHIQNCSLLAYRCQKDRGKDWRKISHIANVYINDLMESER